MVRAKSPGLFICGGSVPNSRSFGKPAHPIRTLDCRGNRAKVWQGEEMSANENKRMNEWFWYAVGAAVLYGLHQVFTKLAAEHISDGLGGFVVEGTAAASILAYLMFLYFAGHWNQHASSPGVIYSVFTGICVGAGTVLFFLLFQKGGPLSAVPMILAGGAAIMAIAGIFFFKEPASWQRLLGIGMAIGGLYLLRK
jgi:transporter family protein